MEADAQDLIDGVFLPQPIFQRGDPGKIGEWVWTGGFEKKTSGI